jgi:hypothetical protein
MSKLDWTYMDDGSYVAPYLGLTLHAQVDTDAQNPFEDGDGHWSMHVYQGRGNNTVYGESLDHPLAAFTDDQLIHDQIAIGKILDITILDLTSAHGPNAAEATKYCTDAEVLRAGFEDRFEAMVDNAQDSEVADLWRLTGATVLSTTVTGYSQGDWAKLLIVATKAQQEAFGCVEPITEAHLQGQADTYAAWAYGDCFGYVITDANGEEIDDGSCWGYYGTDHDESELEESAMNAAECHVRRVAKRRAEKLKTLIRQRVPLYARPALLLAA